MKLMPLLFLLMAASPVTVQVTDERGRKPGGVTVEASDPDLDNWYKLSITKSRGDLVLIWPFDGRAKQPDGPEPVPVVLVEKGSSRILLSRKAVALLAVPVVLESRTLGDAASLAGVDAPALEKAIAGLVASDDGLEKGLALLWSKKPETREAAKDALAQALRARERVMTRIPSEIYPAAMLEGKALAEMGKFDDAAVVYLKALKLRPSDQTARRLRASALEKAGKPEAAEDVLKKR